MQLWLSLMLVIIKYMNFQIAIEIIDTLGFIQGIFFGLFFCILGIVNKSRHNLLFGIFITVYSLELITPFFSLISDAHIIEKNPIISVLPFKFYFLSIVVFYLYVKEISYSKITKRDLLLLIPGIVEFIINLYWVVFFRNTEEFIDSNAIFEFISLLVSIPFNIYILKKIIKIEKENAKIICDQYSSSKSLSIRWCRYSAYIFLFFLLQFIVVFIITVLFMVNVNILEIVISIFNTAIIYWISLKAYEQKLTYSFYNTDSTTYTNGEITDNLSEEFKVIDKIVREKELYKITDLTVFALSKYIDLHPKIISKAINQIAKNNFNNYINTYRVNNAKELLTDVQYNNLSIEGIGYKAGFKSKSAFYRAFKKATNLTPYQYKEE